MTDDVDRAAEYQEAQLKRNLEEHRRRVAMEDRIIPTGQCRNPICELEFDEGDTRLFCDSRCAQEYTNEKRRR